jgi:hypothetical protein
MKTKTLAVIIAIMIIAVLPGCKKDKLQERTEQEQNESYEQLQRWFNLETGSPQKPFPSNKDFRMGVPLWQKTRFYNESRTFITPMKIGGKNEQPNTVYKFLVAEGDPRAGVNEGHYIYLFPDENSTMDVSKIDQNILPDFFLLRNIPAGFVGTIMKYDIDYKLVFSKNIGKGKMTSSLKRMKMGTAGLYRDMDDIVPNSAGLACGQCMSYYLITYDEWGNILNIEYLYTECGECPPPGGGGSGGGNGGGNNEPPTCNLTQAQMEAGLNAITSTVTNGGWCQTGPASLPDQNGIVRASKFCDGGGFTLFIIPGYAPHWEAIFSGFVYRTNSNESWKWESINYTGFPQTGGILPPCVTAVASASGVTSLISADKLKVTTAGFYTCNASWTCLYSTGIRTFTGQFGANLYANTPVN